jgi:hypothetical protein
VVNDQEGQKKVRMLSFFIIGLLTSMTFASGSYGGVYSQNVTLSETSTGATKFGSFVIARNGQNATGIEAITKATGTPLTNNTGSQSNQSSQPAQPLGNLLVEHAGVLLQVCKPTLTILRYRINV